MKAAGGRRPPLAAVAAIAAILLGLAVWGFLRSAYFEIREIRVIGARRVAPDVVRRLAGIPPEANLVFLPVDEVERAVEEDVWILAADARRDLPSTLVIRVLERRVVGWVADPDGVALVAGDGTVVQRRRTPPPSLPELGLASEGLDLGERVDELGEPMRVASSMSSSLLGQVQVVELYAGEVSLELRNGALVRYGAAADLGAKNDALSEVLRWAEREGIEVDSIDVRVPSAPSLRPVGAARPTPYPSPSPGGG